MLTIGQAATLLGVSIDTLRRWESQGKLVPVRTDGNHRRYTEEHISKAREMMSAGKPEQIFAHCVRVSDFQTAVNKLCSRFGYDDVVTLVFGQHKGFPGVNIFMNTEHRFDSEGIPFDLNTGFMLKEEE
jgi:excisionase family DNA binding protein